MKYQIMATLGPSSETEPIWQKMRAAGVTGFRLNTSHLSLEQLERWLARLAPFLAKDDSVLPVVHYRTLFDSPKRVGNLSKIAR